MTRLESALAATAYQREWFAGIRARVAAGEPLALVNADAPQEVLRAMGIPYVVNQWWASVVSARQRADASLQVLRDRGYPDYSRQYDAISLGSHFLAEDEAPWGGLPRPTVVVAETSGDAARKVFDLWDELDGTSFYPIERSSAVEAPSRWWELVPHRWEEAFGPERLDLLSSEIEGLAAFLEERTGRRLDLDRLAEVMDLVNEQAEWNRRTRDLIAAARPTPVAVGDTIPSVMIPQWHRGTPWARDAARRLYEEVADLVDRGAAVAPGERLRLMWLGRGLWYDLGLYRRFQERYGAVFVWSMYLAIAADGYARYGTDPIRTLAARFAGLTDQLYTPPWSTEWYVKEALSHGVDGVVHLVADDVPGSWFTTRALEAAGIPVLEVRANNADPRGDGGTRLERAVCDFIERRLLPSRP
ncbi:2-hydroxyacyl-CoA dehydratase family protein [Geodermatophilus ruber]|uniref:2-hydroxyglutaryl-CoA dehydratase, D-component n=1 Tax=Geodermatophilus ruber TaxID=504800 RepID=A0A1I4A9H5_9ACTN|nr:2-hydroxyacyl-CoA dehydratase family protein [Geodermatophilus ruber]SFK53048.1 2-hydroxyglutaryl-CoA dehydratase, D-component [Geodermatophilus ruber]